MPSIVTFLKCLVLGHDWISIETIEDHIAGTGWLMECHRCKKQKVF